MHPWYALKTKSRFEKVIRETLSGKSIECFLPTRMVSRNWSDRRKLVETPLFPGYIFVKPNAGQFEALKYVTGSRGLVMSAGRAAGIRESEIRSLELLVASDFQVEHRLSLQVGERVYVVNGPLKGAEGILVRAKNQERFVINSEILGQSVSIEINQADLRRL